MNVKFLYLKAQCVGVGAIEWHSKVTTQQLIFLGNIEEHILN